MKTLLLPAAFLLLILNLHAQPVAGKWISSTSGANVSIQSQDVTGDGYIYYAGNYSTPISGPHLYIAKSDTAGIMIWEKYIANVFPGSAEITANEQSVYVASYGSVFRFDTDGNLKWRKYIQEAGQVFVNDVMIDENGGCVIAGMCGITASPKKAAYIVKFDSTGAAMWDKKIQWSGYNSSFFYSLAQDNTGNIYACGGAGLSYSPVDEGTVAKFNSAGTIIWTRNISADTNTPMAFYECAFDGNNLIVAGAAIPNFSGHPIVFARLDIFGTILTWGAIPMVTFNVVSINSLTCTPYNTIIVTGEKSFGNTTEGIIIELDYNFAFIRGLTHPATTALTGVEMAGSHTYISGEKGSGALMSFRGISDYSWNFGCGFESFAVTPVFPMLYYGMVYDSTSSVSVVDSSAAIFPLVNQYVTCDNLAGIDDPSATGFSVYPNPAQEMIVVKFGEALATPTTLWVYDVTGQVVRTAVCNAGTAQLELPISGLSSGTYVLRTEAGHNFKFIVSKQ